MRRLIQPWSGVGVVMIGTKAIGFGRVNLRIVWNHNSRGKENFTSHFLAKAAAMLPISKKTLSDGKKGFSVFKKSKRV
jgi:hypothetical protein